MRIAAARDLPLHEVEKVLLEAAARSSVEERVECGRREVVEAPAANVDTRAVGEQQRLDVALVLRTVPVIADRLAGTLGARRLPADLGEQLPRDGVAVVLEPAASVERWHQP